VDYHYYV